MKNSDMTILKAEPPCDYPRIIQREHHCISRKDIDPDALRVMYRLNRFGYQVFLVGGSVRDLLLGKNPKDFDIGTSATPKQVKAAFRNSRLIGRRFRIVHVFFHANKIIEVSTFRAESVDDEASSSQIEATYLNYDNTYGDPRSDAMRRDITINGLFYDPITYTIIDYVGGLEDLRSKIVRVIGDPDTRFKEDPVRMIRAIRHAARADFFVDRDTYRSICKNKSLISVCSRSRVYEELLREFRGTASVKSIDLLHRTGLLEFLVPILHESLKSDNVRISFRLKEVLRKFDYLSVMRVDLSPSLLLLSIVVGNIVPGLLSQRYESITEEDEEVIWAALPKTENIKFVESGAKILGGRSDSGKKIGQKWFVGRSGHVMRQADTNVKVDTEIVIGSGLPSISIVQKMLNDVFASIGVSRKEQERMLWLMIGRCELFAIWKLYSQISSLDSSSQFSNLLTTFSVADVNRLVDRFLSVQYFADALQFLELTSIEDEAAECCEFWVRRFNHVSQCSSQGAFRVGD